MRFSKIIVPALLLILPAGASAQFYTTGDTSPRIRWNTIESDNYRFIYPRGADSLAFDYARMFEEERDRIGQSTGVRPNETYKNKFPVVLHTDRAYSNGVVVWAPQRLEVYTTPQAYSSEAMPWMREITLHEGRHISQMQFGHMNKLKPLNYLIGEMWAGLCSGLYFTSDWLEGDAVVAETALSRSGRGRRADFLNYYMISFDNGDWRSWWRWMGGSQKLYSPDQYALGYMYYSGMRYFYDAPHVSQNYIDTVSEHPLSIFTFKDNIAKEYSGLNFSKVFFPIAEKTYGLWKEESKLRGPFDEVGTIVAKPKTYTIYEGITLDHNGTIYAFRSSLDNIRKLVSISPEGEESVLSNAALSTSDLRFDKATGRLYWSESTPNPRWTRQSSSTIFYRDAQGKTRILAKGMYFNPAPSENGSVSATQYLREGGSAVVVFASDGTLIRQHVVPSAIQAEQSATLEDGSIFISGICEDGYGIWHLDEDSWVCDLEPQPVLIEGLTTDGKFLYFTSDRNGSNELYRFNAADHSLDQLSSTLYGGNSFAVDERDGSIIGAFAGLDGKLPGRMEERNIFPRRADFSDLHQWAIADRLGEQEAMLGKDIPGKTDISISDPQPYNKIANSFNFYAWAPAYVNPAKLMDFDFDPSYKTLSFGATAISQNLLGNSIFSAGYSLHKDPAETGIWRNSGHLNWTYSGWLPVISANIDIGDRAARLHNTLLKSTDNGKTYYISRWSDAVADKPSVEVSLSATLPLRFSSLGWTTGITPRYSFHMTNDRTAPAIEAVQIDEETNEILKSEEKIKYTNKLDRALYYQTLSLSAFRSTSTPHMAVFPRLGFGGQAGVFIPGNDIIYNSSVFGMAYAYLPGLMPGQGLKATLSGQKIGTTLLHYSTTNYIKTLPRGLADNADLLGSITLRGKSSTLLSLEYAVPFSFGDIDLAEGMLYISRFVLTPHFDYSYFQGTQYTGSLFSAGAELRMDLKSVLALVFPIELGVSASWNGGSLINAMDDGINIDRFYITPTFNVSF